MSSRTQLRYSGSQVRGGRWRQEDAFDFLAKGDCVLAMIADGCGGRPQGRETSKRAVRLFKELASNPGAWSTDIAESLRQWTQAVHQAIRDEKVQPDLRPATTLIAARVSATELHYVSVGDSLLFVTEEGRLRLLPSKRLSERNAVGLGLDDMVSGHVSLKPGDRVLLATDGLYPMPHDEPAFCEYMHLAISENWPPRDIVSAALEWAKRAWAPLGDWHRDNCTVLCVGVPEDAP